MFLYIFYFITFYIFFNYFQFTNNCKVYISILKQVTVYKEDDQIHLNELQSSNNIQINNTNRNIDFCNCFKSSFLCSQKIKVSADIY